MRKSNSHNVTIRGVTRNHTGLYQCEVSADAPLFHTLHKSAQMQVAVMPQMEPTMNVYGVATGEDNKRHINYGDHLKASCIAGPSSPTVNFTWRVNDVVFPVGGSVASSLYFIIQLPAAITLSWMDKVVVRCVWGCTAELPEASVFIHHHRSLHFPFSALSYLIPSAVDNGRQQGTQSSAWPELGVERGLVRARVYRGQCPVHSTSRSLLQLVVQCTKWWWWWRGRIIGIEWIPQIQQQ